MSGRRYLDRGTKQICVLLLEISSHVVSGVSLLVLMQQCKRPISSVGGSGSLSREGGSLVFDARGCSFAGSNLSTPESLQDFFL